MKLDLAQMKAITKGVMDITEENGAFVFHRLNEAQKSIYRPNTGGWRRSQALASVHLDFETDATMLSFTAVNGWNSTGVRYFYFDLWVDGKMLYHDGFTYNENADGSTMMRFAPWHTDLAMPAGNKRVRLYMPAICHVELQDVVLQDATYIKPVESKYRWLAFGDSITEAHSSAMPSMQYTEQVARAIDAEVLNQGTGGEQFMACKIVPGSYPKVDLITVAYGTNDFTHCPDVETFEREAGGFFKTLHEAFGDTPVLVLLPLWRGHEKTDKGFNLGTLPQVRERIRAIARQYPANRIVNCGGFIPPVYDFFADKGLHPNALGHTFYAKGLLPEVEKVLK